MKLCICDDDKATCEEIHNRITELYAMDTQAVITYFNSGEALAERYKAGETYDIIFLDIEMDKMDGLKVAELIRKSDKDAIIIFVSSHSHYVFETFRTEAFHFLLKPIQESEFRDVFNRALNKYCDAHATLVLKWQYTRIAIEINQME